MAISVRNIRELINKGKNYLSNNSHDDIYKFKRGQGINVINENGGYDIIEFTSPDITRKNFFLFQVGPSMLMGIFGTSRNDVATTVVNNPDQSKEIEAIKIPWYQLINGVAVMVLNNLDQGKEIEAIRIPGYQLKGSKIGQLAHMMASTLSSTDSVESLPNPVNVRMIMHNLWEPVPNQQ